MSERDEEDFDRCLECGCVYEAGKGCTCPETSVTARPDDPTDADLEKLGNKAMDFLVARYGHPQLDGFVNWEARPEALALEMAEFTYRVIHSSPCPKPPLPKATEQAPEKTIVSGYIEIDHDRGVIYFHADVPEVKGGHVPTPIRIQGLGRPIPDMKGKQIDINVPEAHSSIE